jgi:hypothetical protein
MSVSQQKQLSNHPHRHNAYPGFESALSHGIWFVGSVLDYPTSESGYELGNILLEGCADRIRWIVLVGNVLCKRAGQAQSGRWDLLGRHSRDSICSLGDMSVSSLTRNI